MREEISEVVRNPLMWVAACAAFCISAGAILLAPSAKEPVVRVSSAPPTTTPDIQIAARPALPRPAMEAAPPVAEEVPEVKIRSLPAKAAPADTALPSGEPGTSRDSHQSVAGSREGMPPGDLNSPELPPAETQPLPLPRELESPRAPAPISPPVVVAPTEVPRNAEPPERAPVIPTPARQPERAIQRSRQPTGLLTIFFDADSTTFDRQRRRMPLRVEVWVDGSLKARSNDPEKRDLEIGLLPAGWHEVEVVPYVGDLPSQPRRRSVLIEPGTTAEYKAVLRREDGVGCVSKFRPRG